MATRQPRSVYDARWRAKHPNYKAPYYPEKAREDYIKNRSVRLARASERYNNMTEEQRAEHNRKRRERHARNPQIRNAVERARDHQKRSGTKFDKGVWELALMKYGYRCIYCDSNQNITVEHRRPVSKGGGNDFHNLAPACLSCNSSKRGMDEGDYREWRIARGKYCRPMMEIVYEMA